MSCFFCVSHAFSSSSAPFARVARTRSSINTIWASGTFPRCTLLKLIRPYICYSLLIGLSVRMPSLKKIFRSFAGQKTKYALPEADEAYDFEYHRSVKSKIKTALNGSAKVSFGRTSLLPTLHLIWINRPNMNKHFWRFGEKQRSTLSMIDVRPILQQLLRIIMAKNKSSW